MSRTAQTEQVPSDTRPVTDLVQPKDASMPTAPGRRRVETPMRPKLPPLASLALPGAISSPATPALSFSTSFPPSSSSPNESPNRPPPRPRHRADDLDGDKAHVQAAIYEALRRRWSASSASELQTLADAAAEALRRKQQQQAYAVLDPAATNEEAASPAWAALRANKRNSDALLDSDAPNLPTSSGLVMPCDGGDEEARDQVSPLPSASSKRRRSPIFPPPLTLPSPCTIAAHRSAVLCASRQQIRTLSLDAGIAEKQEELSRSQILNRHSAFDNLLTSLAAVKTARASLSSPFSPPLPPLRYA